MSISATLPAIKKSSDRFFFFFAVIDASFKKEFLDTHNAYRQKHSTPGLTLTKELCASAQEWANQLLAMKTMQHSSTKHGENLYYAWSSTPKKLTGKEAVDNWYSEIKDYDFRCPGFHSNTGHFTQVVWKDTKEVGVSIASDGQTIFVVGQYSPAGNISSDGFFEKNVLPTAATEKGVEGEDCGGAPCHAESACNLL
ncbi:Golgi-associated plant pathogenesis-related protein 1-like isoform X1 [Arapaima gigas]